MSQIVSDSEDLQKIDDLVDGLFDALSWSPENPPDWEAFRNAFAKDARLFPSARPLAPVSAEEFAERMNAQRESGDLEFFEEASTKNTVHLYGNIAVVLNSFTSTINNGEPGRGVNAMLMVKEDERWKVASMSWQAEATDHPIPTEYL